LSISFFLSFVVVVVVVVCENNDNWVDDDDDFIILIKFPSKGRYKAIGFSLLLFLARRPRSKL
jgi:hypothetical protein